MNASLPHCDPDCPPNGHAAACRERYDRHSRALIGRQQAERPALPDTAAPAEVASGAEDAALTNDEVVTLEVLAHSIEIATDERGDGATLMEGPASRLIAGLVPEFNAILARRGVADRAKLEAEALERAAKAIEKRRNEHWQQHLTEHPHATETSCPRDYGIHDAYYDAAKIVRAALAADPTPDTPQPAPALWPNPGQAFIAGQYPGRDGGGA